MPIPESLTASEIVINALLQAPAIVRLVGDRVTSAPLPPEYARPAIMVVHVGESEGYTLAGADGYPLSQIQTEIISSNSASEAERIGKAVVAALKDYRKGTIKVMKGNGDLSEYDREEALFRRIIDWMVRWNN